MRRFTIVIPAHDSIRTLRYAVESALIQDFSDYNVVISDNFSQDGTADYLVNLRHPRLGFAVSHNNRVGKSENWNRAFGLADKCEYLVMLHSDDVLSPDALSVINKAIGRYGKLGLFYGNHDRLTLAGDRKIHKRIWPIAYRISGGLARFFFTLKNPVSVVGMAIKRDCFIAIGGFPSDLEFMQDQALAVALAMRHGALYMPKKMGFYRDSGVRPAIAHRWSIEELNYISSVTAHYPEFVRRVMLSLRVNFNICRLSVESPSSVPAFISLASKEGRVLPFYLCRLLFILFSYAIKLSHARFW